KPVSELQNLRSYLLKWPEWLPVLIWIVLWAMVLALNSSKAVLSIGYIALPSLVLIYRLLDQSLLNRWQQIQAWPLLLLAGIWLLALLSGLISEDQSRWLRDLRTKVPFLIFPAGLAFMPPLPGKGKQKLGLAFVYAQAVWALLSLGKLAFTYEAQMERVRLNGNIEAFGSISHIYFGLLLGGAVLLGLFYLLHLRKDLARWQRYLLLFAVLICFVTLHILNSRTAQVALYGGLGVFILWEVWQRKNILLGVGLLSLLTLTPLLAYQLIPSFRTRVAVTIWDYQQSESPTGDIANNSLSTRRVGWQAAWSIYTAHPWWGVGLEDVGEEMVQLYQNWELNLPEDLPPALREPHNLYLKYAAGAGSVGLIFLLAVLLIPLARTQGAPYGLLYGYFSLMLISFLFENVLERQIGIMYFLISFHFLIMESAFLKKRTVPSPHQNVKH
ncbi:MAG: O-antigen ligase family protein, partial [Bacteroidota bacterium]